MHDTQNTSVLSISQWTGAPFDAPTKDNSHAERRDDSAARDNREAGYRAHVSEKTAGGYGAAYRMAGADTRNEEGGEISVRGGGGHLGTHHQHINNHPALANGGIIVAHKLSEFVWPFFYCLSLTAIFVFLIWIVFIEPKAVVVSEYQQPRVNNRIATRYHVPVTRQEGLNITRYYEVFQNCPIDAVLGITCENGDVWTFSKKGGGVGSPVLGQRPPRSFKEPLPDDLPFNVQCEFHVRAESRCLIGTHIDNMMPAKFVLMRPSPP